VDYKINYANGTTEIVRLSTENPVTLFKLPLDNTVSGIQFDPGKWLLKMNNTPARDVSLKAPTNTPVTSLENDLKVEFSIYPNPANDKVIIHRNGDKPFGLQVVDVHGRIYYDSSSETGEVNLPLNNIPDGFIFIKLNYYEQ